jgi:hypothetical protein
LTGRPDGVLRDKLGLGGGRLAGVGPFIIIIRIKDKDMIYPLLMRSGRGRVEAKHVSIRRGRTCDDN